MIKQEEGEGGKAEEGKEGWEEEKKERWGRGGRVGFVQCPNWQHLCNLLTYLEVVCICILALDPQLILLCKATACNFRRSDIWWATIPVPYYSSFPSIIYLCKCVLTSFPRTYLEDELDKARTKKVLRQVGTTHTHTDTITYKWVSYM